MTAPQRQQLTEAYGKASRGEKLSRSEQSALARFEKEREERLRWQYYQSIPKKHWRQMSGRQVKIINEQAARYGLPIGGATIDLTEVVQALHDFLSQNAKRLATDEDAMMRGQGSQALEWYREERAKLAQLERREKEGDLVTLHDAQQIFSQAAAALRQASETLERQYGPEAGSLLRDAIEVAMQELDVIFTNTDSEQLYQRPQPHHPTPAITGTSDHGPVDM